MPQKRRCLFIDSASLQDIEEALSRGYQGITTNPSLVAQTPKGDSTKPFFERYIDHMHKIVEICKKYPLKDGSYPSLSVEVFAMDEHEMIKQAREIRNKIDYSNLAVKIPISYQGKDYLKVIKILSEEGIIVNCTCGFSAAQLELAAQAGAKYISLFFNRLIDYFNSLPNSEIDGRELAFNELAKMRVFLDNNSFDCEIILGSIRKSADIVDGWSIGADIVTAGLKVLPEMISHSATDKSVDGFLKDLQAWMD